MLPHQVTERIRVQQVGHRLCPLVENPAVGHGDSALRDGRLQFIHRGPAEMRLGVIACRMAWGKPPASARFDGDAQGLTVGEREPLGQFDGVAFQ